MIAILLFGILVFSLGVMISNAYRDSKTTNIGVVRRISNNNIVLVDIQGVMAELILYDEEIRKASERKV